jgi:hypothetical protein
MPYGRRRAPTSVPGLEINADERDAAYVDDAGENKMKDPRRSPRYPRIHMRLARLLFPGRDRLLNRLGLKFFDYDNYDDLDLFLANGNPDDLIEILQKDGTSSLALAPLSQ